MLVLIDTGVRLSELVNMKITNTKSPSHFMCKEFISILSVNTSLNISSLSRNIPVFVELSLNPCWI